MKKISKFKVNSLTFIVFERKLTTVNPQLVTGLFNHWKLGNNRGPLHEKILKIYLRVKICQKFSFLFTTTKNFYLFLHVKKNQCYGLFICRILVCLCFVNQLIYYIGLLPVCKGLSAKHSLENILWYFKDMPHKHFN